MSKSDERYQQLVKKHWEEETQAWRFFRFELERRWDLLYPGFNEADYFNEVDYVRPAQEARPERRFVKLHFNAEKRGWFQENTVGEADGLIFRARQRLRSRYHCSLTLAPSPGFLANIGGPRMQSWQLCLTPGALVAGMKIASALQYAVTLSTPRAGASERSFHFLAMPRLLRFRNQVYALYEWLEDRPVIRLLESVQVMLDLVLYPAFCIRVHGNNRHAAALVWRLAEDYADLVSFNLVITPGANLEHASAFFFPRPWRPNCEGPETYGGRWTFGAFEMGGFFVQGDKSIYEALTYTDLRRFVNEVSVFNLADEIQKLKTVLSNSTDAQGIEAKLERYCEEAPRDLEIPAG